MRGFAWQGTEPSTERLYIATRTQAWGILEGLEHWGFAAQEALDKP